MYLTNYYFDYFNDLVFCTSCWFGQYRYGPIRQNAGIISRSALQPKATTHRLWSGERFRSPQVQSTQGNFFSVLSRKFVKFNDFLNIFLVSKEAIEVWKILYSRLGFVRFGANRCRRDGYRIRRPGGKTDFGRRPRNAIRSCRYWFLVSVPGRPRLYHRRYKVRQFGSIYQPFVQRKYFFFTMTRVKSIKLISESTFYLKSSNVFKHLFRVTF